MADDLNKKIIIDVSVNTDGEQQVKQYRAAFDSLRNAVSSVSDPLAILTTDISKLSASIEKLNNKNQEGASKWDKFKESTEKNIRAFKLWKEITEGTTGAVKKLWAGTLELEEALTGGIAVLLTFAPAILEWVSSLLKGKDAIDKAKLSLTTLNKAFESSDYSKAIAQMNELKINVGLAKKGFLDKKEVLQQYNSSIGLTMGKTTDLAKVESNLVKNGGAYIKMTLLKASAQLALQDAAKKAYEAEQAKIKSDDESLTFWDKTVDVLNRVGSAGEGAPGVINQSELADKEKHKTAEQRRKGAVKDANDQKDALLAIAARFQTQAADISKTAGFDFFSGEITSPGSKRNSGDGNQTLLSKFTEAEQLRKDSLTRQLQITYDAYGSETLVENEHYQRELAQLKKLLADKQISKLEYNLVSAQLEAEHNTSIAAIITKFNEQDKEKAVQAANELEAIKIKAMKDGIDKQKAELNLQLTETVEQLDKTEEEITAHIVRLNKQISDAKTANPYADVTAIQQQLDAQWKLIEINSQKRIVTEKQTQDAIAVIDTETFINKQAQAKAAKLNNDHNTIDAAKDPATKLAAEKQLIMDRYQFEITEATGNSVKILALEANREKEISALKKKSQEEIKNFAMQEAQELSSAAFSVISNGIKQQSEAKIAGLEKDKTAELSNKSLTSVQKTAIEDKYKKTEAAVKVKAFKDEQKASLAQALINGAIAITKAEAQTGVLGALVIPGIIAETAIQVATIASQKPPAYAKGGLHYSSDGRGGVLPGYSRTDNTNAYLRSGEGIIVSEAMQVPWARNLVSAINVGFGGRDFAIANPGRGYAVGGIFTDGGDANRYYNQPVNDQKSLANTIAYQMINNFPPVYVDVKDVNNQQNILAQTVNRVNL